MRLELFFFKFKWIRSVIVFRLEVQAAPCFFADSGKQDDRNDGDDENNADGEHDGGPGDPQGALQKVPAQEFYADTG